MLDDFFEAFRLSPKERQILTCLLERGIQRASFIAHACEIPRNTVRGILDKLVGDGLLVRTRRGNAHYYAIESEAGLRSSLQSKRDETIEEVNQQLEVLKRAGHLLANYSKSSTRPRVTFYDGHEGLRRVYEDTLEATEPLRSWASFDANQAAMPRYFKNYFKRRAKKGIRMTSIHPDTPLAREQCKDDKKVLRKSLLVPKEAFQLTPEIQVYNNKINIVSWRDKLGIIIESQEVAEAFKAIFDLCFQSAARIYKKS